MAQIILDSNNNLIQGDFDNATLNNRTKLQTTTTNATTNVYVVPNGSSTSAGVSVANNSSLTNASKIVMATNGTTDTQIISGVNGSGSYLPLSFYTNNALAMQVDTSGNLGIGVTPSSQYSTVKALQVGALGATIISGNTSAGGTSSFGQNWYSDPSTATLKYAASSYPASNYSQYNGTHLWYTAPSGTAGNNITFTESMRIDTNGYLLVGFTGTISGYTSTFTNYANGAGLYGTTIKNISATNTTFMSFLNSSNATAGQISQTGSTTVSYTTSSDYRLKENIVPMTGALDKVALLKPVTYTWKSDGLDGQGFIAHELQAVVPDAVVGEKDAVDAEGNIKAQGIDTSFLVATLTAAIQEQQTIINDLKARIETLEAK
jgi:hypothetical protein